MSKLRALLLGRTESPANEFGPKIYSTEADEADGWGRGPNGRGWRSLKLLDECRSRDEKLEVPCLEQKRRSIRRRDRLSPGEMDITRCVSFVLENWTIS